ncbi:uncharacterized protein LOC128736823 [Sabethes cyaneus]|uniref:uncharacterized protein LOC128736822 n=1 Tax=Sabethes cyaneus TaxID=53552 RepID=UPI00237D9B22|nr:uncharacterized protein LOC128736822 [Sabethes cyaneus]XP_053687291.1 uncharacterized protein LOC128736823 [Sabethes cyaneus]
MGSPISPVVADIVMEKLEKDAIDKLNHAGVSIKVYRRYVDDCFLVGKEQEIEIVQETFNSICNSLQFTVEKEENASLRFLDIEIMRVEKRLQKKWHPKQQSGRYLDYTSESPHMHKTNTAIALIDRALKLTTVEKREESIQSAVATLRKNNYPEQFVHNILKKRVHLLYNTLQNTEISRNESTMFVSIPYIPGLSERIGKSLRKHDIIAAYKPNDKIKTTIFTKLKDQIPIMQQTNVVYSIPCGVCNDKEYIGQTSQMLEKRIKQHKNSIRTSSSITGLTQHTIELGHVFDFSNVHVLERINSEPTRLTAEMLHIKIREQRAVNLQRDAASFSNAYNGLINQIRSLHTTKGSGRTAVINNED